MREQKPPIPVKEIEKMEPMDAKEFLASSIHRNPDAALTFYGQYSMRKIYDNLKDFIEPRKLQNINYPNFGSFYVKKLMDEMEIDPEYDLKQVYLFYHNEPMIEQAIKKRVELTFKNGWKIVGEKKKVTDYAKRRLNEVCVVGKTTPEIFFRELFANLIKYSNSFAYKVRDEDNSTGSTRRMRMRKKKTTPIATYQIISPLLLKPVLDGEGRIKKWAQYAVDGVTRLRYINPDDIIHFAINRESGYIFGKPMILSIIPDVEALRRIEENVQMLIAQHLFPLYQYIVGTETAPATYFPNGESEVEVVKKMVVSLPTQGVMFTPERHTIKSVSDAKSMDVVDYMEYFRNRVFLGLGVSSVDMGISDTSNRGTAVTISQNLKDSIGADQKIFSELVNLHILRELLMESKFNMDFMSAFTEVGLRFMTIDTDELIKRETHILSLYVGGVITHDEVRDLLNHDPITEDQLLDNTQLGFKAKLEAYIASVNAALTPKPAPAAPSSSSTGAKTAAKPAAKKASISTKKDPVISKALTILKPQNSLGSMLGPKRTTNSEEGEEEYDEELLNEFVEFLKSKGIQILNSPE